MLPDVVTTADIHLTNDDPYGVHDDSGLNDFLTIKYDAFCRIIDVCAKGRKHLVVAGDFLDNKIVDSHTLYFSSKIIKKLNELPFVILTEGNHGYDDKRGVYSVIAHWKHLIGDNLRIVTYPKIERKDGVAYHCVPALSEVSKNFTKIIGKLRSGVKKSDRKSILILHAGIVGAMFESGSKSTSGIPFKYIQKAAKEYDYVVCGDYHRHQFLLRNVWYCGAPIQSTLKDKGQDRGYQIVDLNNDKITMHDAGGPKFYEINWEVSGKKPKVIKNPLQYRHIKRAVVIIRLKGYSSDIEKVDREELQKRFYDSGCFRVYVEDETYDKNDNRVIINKDLSDAEMVQSFCEKKKSILPAPIEEVIERGNYYLQRSR